MRLKIYFLLVIFTLFSSKIIYAQNINELKSEIYSKLRDHRCSNMTIDKSNCPEAREMRAYVDALIEVGLGKEDIFYKVAKKFSLKTILDDQIKSDIEKRLIKEAGGKIPRIILDSLSFDFGSVSKKQGKIKKIFKLYNKGTAELIITNLKPICPCTIVSLKVGNKQSPYFEREGAPDGWQLGMDPNQEGELEVILDLNHPSVISGILIREVAIFSNDPLYSEVTVTVKAEVTD